MSDGYGYGSAVSGHSNADADSGKVETAKQEAGAVKDTAAGAAKDVAHTAKDEATSVASEAKSQVKDLYVQSRTELSDQASKQQARIASGLKSAGDELGSLARNSENGGVATDLVQQISTRLSGAGSWLESREPAAVLDEVKRFARRRPLVFIAGAAVAGVVVGRLVRALAANQHDESTSSMPSGLTAAPVTPPPVPPVVPPTYTGVAGATGAAYATSEADLAAAPVISEPAYDAQGADAYLDAPAAPAPVTDDDAPLYNESAATWSDARREGSNERPDTV